MYKISELSKINSVLADLMIKIDANPKHLLSPKGHEIFSIQEYETGADNITEYLVDYTETKSITRVSVTHPEHRGNGLIIHHRALEVRENSHDFNIININATGEVDRIMYHPTSDVLHIYIGGDWQSDSFQVNLPNYKNYDDMDAWLFQQNTVRKVYTNIEKFFMSLQKYKNGRKRLPKFSISFEHISLDKLVELYDEI